MKRWRRSSRRPVTARTVYLACAAIAAAALAVAAGRRRHSLPPVGLEVSSPALSGNHEPMSREPVSTTGGPAGSAGPAVR